MSVLDRAERTASRYQYAENDLIISDYKYNLILGGIVAYGLFVNIVLCSTIKDPLSLMSPIMFIILYAVCAIVGTIMSASSDNPYVSFAGYNLVVVPCGLVVSAVVNAYTAINPSIISTAFSITFVITLVMIILGSMYPQFFFSMGGVLCITLFGVIISSGVCMLLGINDFFITVISAGLFSLYIGHDYAVSQEYTKTVDNAVDSALDIYLDIINLFLKLVRILAETSGNSSRRRRY